MSQRKVGRSAPASPGGEAVRNELSERAQKFIGQVRYGVVGVQILTIRPPQLQTAVDHQAVDFQSVAAPLRGTVPGAGGFTSETKERGSGNNLIELPQIIKYDQWLGLFCQAGIGNKIPEDAV